jgi:hypothetical protein
MNDQLVAEATIYKTQQTQETKFHLSWIPIAISAIRQNQTYTSDHTDTRIDLSTTYFNIIHILYQA